MDIFTENIETVLNENADRPTADIDNIVKNSAKEGLRQQIEEIIKFLKEQPQQLETYDGLLVRILIEKITIHERQLTIEFKSGMEVKRKI